MSLDQPHLSDQMRRAREVVPRYSKKFSRGALGGLADGRSVTGKWIRKLEAELLAHLGHEPSITERLMIERVVRVRLQLENFDQRIAAGEPLTALDGRVYSALINSLRLTCRDLGLRPQAPKEPSLAEHLARNYGQGSEAA